MSLARRAPVDPVSPAELDYIVWALGEQGHTVHAVAEHLDRPATTIWKKARKLGVKPKHSPVHKFSDEQLSEMMRLVRSSGIRAAARAFGVDCNVIGRHAARAGVSSPYLRGGKRA